MAGELKDLNSSGWHFYKSKPKANGHTVFIDKNGHFLIEGYSLVVEFNTGISKEQIDSCLKRHDLKVERILSRRKPRFKVRNQKPESSSAVVISQELEKESEVKWSEAEFVEVIGHR